MAADVPVLVNAELLAGARYAGARGGLVRSPDDFHTGISEMLDSIDSYAPRDHLLALFSRERVVEKFVAILRDASAAAGKDISIPALSGSGAG